METFWNNLPKPFFCLAPMADVTDPAYRKIIAKYGKPHVMWTEFVSSDGLFKGGYDALIGDLQYTEGERPIVAQFFSKDVELMVKSAQLAEELGFDGVDINMGCPDRNVCKQGAGAAMINEPELAREIILATKAATALPVSVKTRIGFNTNEVETWIPNLLSAGPAALCIHGRTKKEMSKVPARWDVIARAVEIRDISGSETLIIGNGDVQDLSDGRKKAEDSGVDGVMFGRAIFGNPWFFRGAVRPDLRERLTVLLEHIQYFNEFLPNKNFMNMKKHFKSYLSGEEPNKELLQKLMDTRDAEGVSVAIEQYLTEA